MHTLRKLPIARPRMAKMIIKSISTGVYCGRITDLSQYLVGIIARHSFFCHCESRLVGAWQSRCEKRDASVLDRLPAQEGIGHIINDIPDISGVACARIGDCDYVPACP
jgi:hypothetical protein